MNTKTNVNTKKLASLLIALLMVFNVGAITVFAGNGDGTGGGNQNAPLHFVIAKYSTGSGYATLDEEATISSGPLSGYIRFDRGMTDYGTQAENFSKITLSDGVNTYALNLQQASNNISDGNETIDKKYLYMFSVSYLPAGDYTLTLGAGIKANNEQTLSNAPVYVYFSVE